MDDDETDNMKNQNGFTLFSLIFSISLTITLGALCTNGSFSFLDRRSANSSAELILHSFQHARTMSVTHGKVISLCGSNDGSSCDVEWQNYLLIFSDVNKNHKVDNGELIARTNFQLKEFKVVTRVSLGHPYIDIKPDGSPKQWGSLIYCPKTIEHNDLIRRVTWNRAGRPYYGRDTDGDGVVNASNGRNLNC